MAVFLPPWPSAVRAGPLDRPAPCHSALGGDLAAAVQAMTVVGVSNCQFVLEAPVGGRAPAEADRGDRPVKLTAADFDIDVTARRAAVCPAGHEAVSEYEDEEAPERVEMHFAREVCEPCSLRSRCPVRWRRRPELGGEWSPRGAYVLSADLARVNIGRRRRAESDGQWRKRYGLRAGIEGTNSELKRRHGLGRLRVRGGERVRLAVYLKALACNVKRMVRARLDEMLVPPAALATAPPPTA